MLQSFAYPTILDVGGGHGQVTEGLLRNGCEVTILGSAESCRKRVDHLLDGDKCSFVIGNLVSLPFPDRHFDVVVSYRLLPHCARWEQLIAELCRVARQAVIVDYPEIRSVNAIAPWLFQWKKGIEKNTRPFTCFRKSDLLKEFHEQDFEMADRYPEFFLPMVLHRALKITSVSAGLERVCRAIKLTSLFGSPVILKLVRRGA